MGTINTDKINAVVEKTVKAKVIRVPIELVPEVEQYIAYYNSIRVLKRRLHKSLAAFREKNNILSMPVDVTLHLKEHV